MVRAGLSPLAEVQRVAIKWLERYFELYGDDIPNADEVMIQVMLKKSVYELYVKHMKQQGDRETIDLPRFYTIWNVLFPKHRKRPYCDIPGSCDTCYQIDRLRRQENDTHTVQMLKDAHLMHRGGLFMLERDGYNYQYFSLFTLLHINLIYFIRYMSRREEVHCEENVRKPYILSLIIDIMDQSHCVIPSKGTQGTFTDPLKQMIFGVKEHGYGVHLFPAIDSVRKGGNLIVYILDTVIENWKRRHNGNYPTIIYLQVDGGSENANK